MKKAMIATAFAIVFLVIIYLLLSPVFSPCEGIFKQTAPTFETNLNIIKSKGKLILDKKILKNLSERSERTAMNLKTCCVLSHSDKLSSKEFLRCKEGFQAYDVELAMIASTMVQVEEADNQGNSDLVKEKREELNNFTRSAVLLSQSFEKRVKGFEERPLDSSLIGETEYSDIVADLIRFEDTGGMLTVEVNFRNTGLDPKKIYIYSGSDNYLIDEVTGKIWGYTIIDGDSKYITLQPGESHLVWMKYLLKKPYPSEFTININSLKRPFEGITYE